MEFAKKLYLCFCFFTNITKILRESLIFDNLVTIPENAWLLLRVRYNRKWNYMLPIQLRVKLVGRK